MKSTRAMFVMALSAVAVLCETAGAQPYAWVPPGGYAPAGYAGGGYPAVVAPSAPANHPYAHPAQYVGELPTMPGYVESQPGMLEPQAAGDAEGEVIEGGCPDCSGADCGHGYRTSRTWGAVEYLLWWSKDRPIPPLVTTSPPGTPVNTGAPDFTPVAGTLGQPETEVLFGDESVGNGSVSGFRLQFGLWLDTNQTLGVGGRYFTLGDNDDEFFASSEGDPILARPFTDTSLPGENALLVAYPGVSTGSIEAQANNDIEGGDVFLRQLVYAGYGNRVDIIGGYQYSRLDDDVQIAHSLVSQDPLIHGPVGTRIDTIDSFEVRNEFHGGTVGLMSEAEDGRLTWRLMSKVGFGKMKETVRISGNTVVTAPNNAVATNDYGLLALPTNIGTYEQDDFVIVPEGSISVGYKLTQWLEISAGYSVIYWTGVQLAGDAIDTTINPTQIGGPLFGPARPAFAFDDTSFWAQGITFGLDWRY